MTMNYQESLQNTKSATTRSIRILVAITILSVLCAAISLVLLLRADIGASQPIKLDIAGGPDGMTFKNVAEALKSELKPQFELNVVPSQGAVDNLKKLEGVVGAEKADIGLVHSHLDYTT